jgi:hypothetical protein
MKRSHGPLIAAGLLALAWSCGGHPTPAQSHGDAAPAVKKEPPSVKPEVVELPWKDEGIPSDYECAAEQVKGGVLDRSSPMFRRIEVHRGRQVIEERAFYRQGPADEVTVTTGGCAHFGTSYRFLLRDTHDLADKGHYIDRALELMEALPVLSDSPHLRDEIGGAIREQRGDPNKVGTCDFRRGDAVIGCSIAGQTPGHVLVQLYYDFAL